MPLSEKPAEAWGDASADWPALKPPMAKRLWLRRPWYAIGTPPFATAGVGAGFAIVGECLRESRRACAVPFAGPENCQTAKPNSPIITAMNAPRTPRRDAAFRQLPDSVLV